MGRPLRPPTRRPTASLLSAGLLAALGLAGCTPPPAAVEERGPVPVVLIVVDTLRVDRLGSYGHDRDTSPAIDGLAADGVRYEKAYSAAPWTTPSVGALLSSHYPSVLGITDAPHPLPEETVLLPEVLSEAGWITGAVVSHYFLGKKWRFDQGFGTFDESNVLGHKGISSSGVTDTALGFARAHRDELFFLFVHYFDPHYDYIEHPGHRYSSPDYQGPVASAMGYQELVDRAGELGPADRAHLFDLYDSEIAFTDREIGRLLDGLAELGLYDEALIVFTADHGEEFLERSTIGHGGTLFNELIHVPLVVRYPRRGDGFPAAGTTVAGNVSLVDVYPTILDFLELPVDHPISGRSFLGDGPGAEPEPRLVFAETDWGEYRAVVRDELKMIHRIPSGQTFFFDLGRDPGETDSLTAKLAQTGRHRDFLELRDELTGWMGFLEKASGVASPVELSEEEVEALKALGYLN